MVYIVQENADRCEGRGPMINVAAFLYKVDALSVAQNIFGGNIEEVRLFSTLTQYNIYQKNKLRDKALAKLTEEEKICLGVK